MKNLSTSDYIKLMIVHNIQILFYKFQIEFYKFFDWFEMLHWVHVQKRGNKGDYHMYKLGQIMKTNEGQAELDVKVIMFYLLRDLQYNYREQHEISFMFYPTAYSRFIFDRGLLNQMSLICSVVDKKTLLDAGDLLGLNFRDRYRRLHGVDALTEYENSSKETTQ